MAEAAVVRAAVVRAAVVKAAVVKAAVVKAAVVKAAVVKAAVVKVAVVKVAVVKAAAATCSSLWALQPMRVRWPSSPSTKTLRSTLGSQCRQSSGRYSSGRRQIIGQYYQTHSEAQHFGTCSRTFD